MNITSQQLHERRDQLAARLAGVPGVISVGIGKDFRKGSPILLVLADQKLTVEAETELPDDIAGLEIEVRRVGESIVHGSSTR